MASHVPRILVFNPGSASLKFEVIEVAPQQAIASQGCQVVSASIEGVGKKASLLVFRGKEVVDRQPCDAANMGAGARFALSWLRNQRADGGPSLGSVGMACVRVVHGGSNYTEAVRVTPAVKSDIESLRELAPLHNQSSLDILAVLEQELPDADRWATFDTAFHRTLPEVAWRYPILRETADRCGIRKFGFHGLSHRYMLEQYAEMAGKTPGQISAVTLHLESGCSAAAISKGKSIDTTMGLTPLEGLMMGTRCGSIDPAIVPLLMRKRKMDRDEVLEFLNKQCGLLGIAGETFDTRDLVKRDDEAAKLALAMFSYRIRLAIGAYLAALGDAEAVLFGGGIGEDTPLVRAQACQGLESLGLVLDQELNARTTAGPASITRPDSRLRALVIPVEEGLQIAHECSQASRKARSTAR